MPSVAMASVLYIRWASTRQIRAMSSHMASEMLAGESALDVNFTTRRRIQEAFNLPEPPPGVVLSDS